MCRISHVVSQRFGTVPGQSCRCFARDADALMMRTLQFRSATKRASCTAVDVALGSRMRSPLLLLIDRADALAGPSYAVSPGQSAMAISRPARGGLATDQPANPAPVRGPSRRRERHGACHARVRRAPSGHVPAACHMRLRAPLSMLARRATPCLGRAPSTSERATEASSMRMRFASSGAPGAACAGPAGRRTWRTTRQGIAPPGNSTLRLVDQEAA